ncbi:MAG: hypothetical protein MZU84_06130 [Sphingobacterium sp.]|nr:hypothetical protein [Sphingobacterium sp.]
MIKVTNIVSLLAAPIIVKYNKMTPILAVVVAVLLGATDLGHLEEQARGPVPLHRDQVK